MTEAAIDGHGHEAFLRCSERLPAGLREVPVRH